MSVTVEAPYRPYRDAARHDFRWRLGLHPLDLHDWIEWGPDADAAVAAKAEISTAHADTTFAALDGIEAEAAEMAAVLVDHLRVRWPERFGAVGLRDDLHPLDAAARLVPEDLVLMVERDGRLVFGGGSVCFPNRWDLLSKLGLTLAEVHEPVPRLNDQLAPHIDRFLDHLEPGRAFWRLGWGIIDTAEWYAPVEPDAAVPTVERSHLRVERETLRRFPATRAVLFTIRTYVSELPGLPDRAELGAAIEHIPPDVREYKELTEVGDDLVAALVGDATQT